MDKSEIIEKLKLLKPRFQKEGLLLLGLFGSYAQDKATDESDIDILIETTPEFLNKYKGFRAFSKLDEIKDILKAQLKKDIDLVDKTGLLQHGNNYILNKTIYV